MKAFRIALVSALLSLVCFQAQAGLTVDQFSLQAGAGASLSSVIQPATAAVQTVKSTAGVVAGIVCFNMTSAPVFVHMFDVVSGSITMGTTSANYQFMCPGNTGGAGFIVNFVYPVAFSNAINYLTSLNITATDHTAITGSSVIVDVLYQ